MRDFRTSRFAEEADNGIELPNLADLMLVFATGLIAALAASGQHQERLENRVEISRDSARDSREGVGDGRGLEAAGQVFRDPASGKLYLVK